jgi:hypothetical protein
VKEPAALHKALARVVSVDEPVDAPQVGFLLDLERLVARREHLLDFFYALAGKGVGGEKAREGVAAGEIAQFFERTEERDHLSRIVDPLARVFDAQRVRLPLVIPAVLEKEELDPDSGQAGDLGERLAQGTADSQADLDEQHLAHPVDAVPGVDMPQLMAQDDGQFGPGPSGQDPRHIDVVPERQKALTTGVSRRELIGSWPAYGNKRLTDALYVGIDLRAA